MVLKRFLMIIGIVLLIVLGAIGIRTFVERDRKDQLVPTSPKSSTKTEASKTTPVKEPEFDKKAYSNDLPASIWVVVNKTRPLNPLNYAPSDLNSVGNNQQMRQEAATALNGMFAAAKNEGFTVQADSGYRSYDTQVSVYNNEVSRYGQTVADSESARPGYSEHQTGLAVDVGSGSCHIDNCFGETAEGKWVAAHAYEFGFIIRYTAAKQSITGYRAEPWHIRYIGKELATEMHNKNVLTLEEFFGLPAAPDYK